MSSRRKFSAEFKADAVELVISSGRPIVQVAEEIGVSDGSLGNWVRAWKKEHPDAGGDDRGPVEWAQYKALEAENAELKRENRIFGKSQRLLCREATVKDYFDFVAAQKAYFPVAWMCRKLGISRASYYRRLHPKPKTATQVRHEELETLVTTEFHDAKGMAGRDQLTLILGNKGVKISAGTVGSIMADHKLEAVRKRAWKKTTAPDPDARTEHIKNHMLDADGNRDFSSTVPGTRLCGDITYLRTGSGWLYLATVIDLANGKVIGWSMDSHMRRDLVIQALAMARDHGQLDPNGAIFHSDRGSQYTSSEFQKWCKNNKVTQSMGETGVAWDNAVAESFFSHFKTEMYHQRSFPNHLAARTAVMEYIEVWYNRKRPHARNNGIPPETALQNYQNHRQIKAA
ncbi:IS3 family transposase [Jonesiaceae bacterium BS-20]|uniref:IS3 family transposase n=1 Tax=Jonesiaceae bacterium BS-20 TaxID=3120821 RepID=A0AAU7DZF0_9MICO